MYTVKAKGAHEIAAQRETAIEKEAYRTFADFYTTYAHAHAGDYTITLEEDGEVLIQKQIRKG